MLPVEPHQPLVWVKYIVFFYLVLVGILEVKVAEVRVVQLILNLTLYQGAHDCLQVHFADFFRLVAAPMHSWVKLDGDLRVVQSSIEPSFRNSQLASAVDLPEDV